MFSAIPLLSVLAALIVAGGIKFVVNGLQGKWSLWSFSMTGGMPSQHTAIVSALATSILITEGFSTGFAISIALAGIVIRDAFGMRRSVGEEGQALAKLLKKNHVKQQIHIVPGHTPPQVFFGALLGVVIALIITFI
ncbi:divergent PAP2 family protein [Candidatus Woesearchaeota archaeon]|nr:divergent PAP2 family protein [Candidatus Woesearchaeota archaeon]